MLELSAKTNLLEENDYRYSLQDVKDPVLYRDVYNYDEVPKVAFNHRRVPTSMPADIWITDTSFRDGQQSMNPYTPEQIEHLFKLLSKLGGPYGLIRQTEFFIYSKRDREAIERCQALGLRFPEITTWIRATREDMLDIYEIRLQLEGLAAKRAAASITDDVLSEMKEVLDLQRFYIESEKDPGENSDQVKNLDSRFHELLYNSCGSRPYADTLISLHKKIIKYRKASVTHHSRAVHALEEHTAIYEALAAHDGDRAAEASLRHVENARANLADIIQKEG